MPYTPEQSPLRLPLPLHPVPRACRVEPLEARRLMAFGDLWGQHAQLIRQNETRTDFPEITGAGQSVAVLDTGIDYNHPRLGRGFGPGKKVVGGWDFVDGDADPMDEFGHGTAVAGLIAANPFVVDGRSYQGIAPGANLLALRVDQADDPVPDERIEDALRWVLDHREQYNIVAANISFGSGHHTATHTSIYSDELAELKSRGVFVAAASGNSGVSEPFGIQYPAADPSVYSVGAVDEFDTITEWSERGPNLDMLAPGDDVYTTSLGPDDFQPVSGTSFAVPIVCGAVALLRQANPDLRVQDVYSVFRSSSKDNLDGDAEFGTVTNLTYRRLDLHDAVATALARRAAPHGQPDLIAEFGSGNGLAYDADGVLHVAYYDSIDRNMKYVTRLTSGVVSAPTTVDTSGRDVGGALSLAVDSHGRPAVAYFDGSAGDLRFAHFNGATWDVETIDERGSVGLYPSMTYDGAGRAVISYFRKASGDLRVATQYEGGWAIEKVDTDENVGRSTDIAYNPLTNELAVAYEDSTHGWLKIARNVGGLFAGGTWTIELVDNLTLGVTHTSIAFDAVNRPAVSYYDIYHADLKFSHYTGIGWATQKLASKGAQGLYSQLYFTPDGAANILYHNRKNNLVMRVRGGIPEWEAEALQTEGGRYIAVARNPLDDTTTYTWYERNVGKLRVAQV